MVYTEKELFGDKFIYLLKSNIITMTSAKEMEQSLIEAKLEIAKDLGRLIDLIEETKNVFGREGSSSYLNDKIKEIQRRLDVTKNHLERLKQTERMYQIMGEKGLLEK